MLLRLRGAGVFTFGAASVIAACHGSDRAGEAAASPAIARALALPAVTACAAIAGYQPDDLPTIPIGYDAYRSWEKWPIAHLNQRTFMRSTYDRGGSNYDSSHFIRKTDGEYVTLDVLGNGVLAFFRANHWHGSPWDVRIDGASTIVQEQSTATPDQPVPNSTFLPADAFPAPLAETWTASEGADVWWVPLGFSSQLELRYQQVHYGTGYYIYDQFPEGIANVSQPPCTWDKAPPPADVVTLFGTTAADLPPAGAPAGSGHVDLGAAGVTAVTTLTGPGVVRVLNFDVAEADAPAFGHAKIRITWDGAVAPSVDAEIGLFFGTGSLFNRDAKRDLVAAFPFTVRFLNGRVFFTTVFPMPFSTSAKIELAGAGIAVSGVNWSVRADGARPPGELPFHATDVDVPVPTPGRDMVFLDTANIEGSADWCGTFIGNSFTFTDHAVLTTLEGDPRFFFDDNGTPQAQGTGTEEWGGGGDYWQGGQTMTLAFAGHPVGAGTALAAKNAEDQIHSAYRVLLADAMPFGKHAVIQLEHGQQNDSVEHYRSVAFWYGQPGACLVQSDELDVGNVASESAHGWVAEGASAPASLTSSYELGTISVPMTDDGRTIATRSEMRLAVPPDNVGVMLRRRLDYAVPDQLAVVTVLDDATGQPVARAGTWYLAGSTTVVVADSPLERGGITESTEISPNRWRDDEFLIPRKLTEGKSSLRLRIDVASAGWSAFRYWAFAYERP